MASKKKWQVKAKWQREALHGIMKKGGAHGNRKYSRKNKHKPEWKNYG